jgi:hypothetical protein
MSAHAERNIDRLPERKPIHPLAELFPPVGRAKAAADKPPSALQPSERTT